jgi:hypothetical protein
VPNGPTEILSPQQDATLSTIRERVGRDDQIGGALPVTLEHGVRAVRVRSLCGADLLIVLDRAMDVAHCSYRGVPLVWHGPGVVLPPEPGTLNDDAYERRFFGGLLTTCGLEAFGPPGRDEFGSWGQHGHINHCPAEEIAIRTDLDDAERFVEIRGVVRQARLFGEALRLERTWTMPRDGTRLRLHDRIVNEAGSAVPHMLLYHCNAGYPLLDESTRVAISQRSMRPRDDRAKAAIDVWNRGGAPDPHFEEQVFVCEAAAGDDGWAEGRFENAPLGIALAIRFRPEELPWCVLWRMLGVRDYVMAIEPANCETIEGRIVARERGTLPMLGAGEAKEYHLEFGFSDVTRRA